MNEKPSAERIAAWVEALRDEAADGTDFELSAASGLEIAAILERTAELERENAKLSANQCLYTIHGDDYGNPYCPRVRELERELAEAKRGGDPQRAEAQKESEMDEEAQTRTEMPKYRCHKVVHALKILEVRPKSTSKGILEAMLIVEAPFFPVQPGDDYFDRHDPKPGGYYVVYKDGYESYSPAEAFESGYTRI